LGGKTIKLYVKAMLKELDAWREGMEE